MRNTILSFYLTFFTILFAFSQDGGKEFPLEDVLTEVKNALKTTQTELKDENFPLLKTVDLTFQAVTAKPTGAKFKFLIFSFGKKIEKEQTQTVTFSLNAPEPNKPTKVSASPLISEQLISAMKMASESVKELESDDEVPLNLSTVAIELKFMVKKTDEGSLGFEISPVTIEASGNLSKTAIHTVKLTFSNE